MKVPVARSKTKLRFIFLLKSKSKLSSVACGSRKQACLRRRSSNRSLRRVSSSETRQAIRSMGDMASAWACRKRVSKTAAIPPRRSWRRARFISIRFMGGRLLGFLLNQIAVLEQIANQGIDLLQAHGSRRAVLEVVSDEAILVHSHLQNHGTSFIHRRCTKLFSQSEHALDAADGNLTLVCMQGATEDTDMRARLLGSPQQLMDAQGSSWRTVLGLDAM